MGEAGGCGRGGGRLRKGPGMPIIWGRHTENNLFCHSFLSGRTDDFILGFGSW